MNSLLFAIQFMTRIPVPAYDYSDEAAARSVRWFPAVGVLVGAVVAGSAWLGLQVHPSVGALFALVSWVGVTGALHLDGLGDIADAAGAGHADPERIDAVLADPRLGSFGGIAIVMQLLAKLVLLSVFVPEGELWQLTLVAVAARAAPMIWTLWLPHRHDDLASQLRAGAAWWRAALGVAVVAIAVPWAHGLIAFVAAVPLWGLWLRRSIGGLSGDGHGAGIELVETAMLLGLVTTL